MIPKILHRIWLNDDNPPYLLYDCADSFDRQHKGWLTYYHNDTEVFNHPSLSQLRDELNSFYEKLKTCNGRGKGLAFQADLIKFCVVYAYGGVFLDWDLYFVRAIDRFLDDDFLIGQIKSSGMIGEHIIGAEAGNAKVLACLLHYMRNGLSGEVNNMAYTDMTTIAQRNGWTAYPTEYFAPHPRNAKDEDRYKVTPDTYAVHLYYNDFEYNLEFMERQAKRARRGQYAETG